MHCLVRMQNTFITVSEIYMRHVISNSLPSSNTEIYHRLFESKNEEHNGIPFFFNVLTILTPFGSNLWCNKKERRYTDRP